MKTTIRKHLDAAEFDWTTGEIYMASGVIAHDSPALDVEFNDGYGESEAEPIVAWDVDYTYFYTVYDGSEWINRVPRDVAAALRTSFAPMHFGGQ